MRKARPKKIEPLKKAECTALVPISDKPKSKPPVKSKKEQVEREVHKQAFAYYYDLGTSRTLAQVAERFETALSVVFQWSARFQWTNRIKALENRSKETLFKDRAMEILLLLLDSFSKRDESGKMVLIGEEKAVFEKVKLAIDSFKRLRDDSREGEPAPEGSGNSGTGKGKNQVMVNVIITK